MEPLWWVVLSVFSASVAGGLVYFVMRSSTDVLLARQREKLAAAHAALGAQKDAMADSMKYAKESARREALDDFLSDIRIEERHYIREHKALFITRKSVIRQERIFFRNLPLSNWIEQEMPYEEGADVDALARTMAIFAPEALLENAEAPARRLLR